MNAKCPGCNGKHDTIEEYRVCQTGSRGPRITEVAGTRPAPQPKDFLGLGQPERPSGKALDWAHTLLRDREPYGNVLDAENTGGSNAAHEVLNSMDAQAISKFIDKMKTRPRRATQPGRTTAVHVEEGFYLHDHQYYKVQRAVHGSGHLYAKRWVVPTGGGGEPFWEMAAGAVSALRPEEALTIEEAAEFGHLYGCCVRCGRTLTDEESIAAGIGPICAGKMGW
jgi:hypothetical protein